MRSRSTIWASWSDHRRDEVALVDMPLGGDMPCALFFPADYEVGMANLGFHYIYRALAESGVAVERFFASPIPYRSVERDTLLERFEIILAGVSFENDISVLIDWLRSGGVDPRRQEADDDIIVGAGGAITYINPLVLSGIADVIFLGDGVSLVRHAVDVMRRVKEKKARLKMLAEHPSILVPSIHLSGRAKCSGARVVNKDTSIDDEYGHSTWITPRTVFGSTLLLELQRGCLRGCRYCTLPSCFRPRRVRDIAKVVADLHSASRTAEYTKVGLITPEASDYDNLELLLGEIRSLQKEVSFASLRVDSLTDAMIDTITSAGRKGLTIAPESGSDDLRRSCGKAFSNHEIVEILAMAKHRGVRSVKLYFMIGLPNETDADVAAIASLCGSIRKEVGVTVTATVSPFVPKPGTAWAMQDFAGRDELKRRYAILSAASKPIAGVAFQKGEIKDACREYVLSWCSYGASRSYAADAKHIRKASADRDGVLRELDRIGLQR